MVGNEMLFSKWRKKLFLLIVFIIFTFKHIVQCFDIFIFEQSAYLIKTQI